MDRLVRLMSTRGGLDFLFKLTVLLLIMGGMNWLRDVIEHGAGADRFINNFLEAAYVGVIPTALALMLVKHLNRLQNDLSIAALTDPLTGLPNRRGFFDAVEAVLPQRGGVLIMLDADLFKRVNDTHGHSAGDQCLIRIAQLMRDMTSPGDVLGRLGGEEFAVVLVGAGLEEARRIGDKLVAGVTIDVPTAPPPPPHVSMSAGAVSTDGGHDLTRLLSRADAALYEAKAAGRARLIVAPPEDHPAPLSDIEARRAG